MIPADCFSASVYLCIEYFLYLGGIGVLFSSFFLYYREGMYLYLRSVLDSIHYHCLDRKTFSKETKKKYGSKLGLDFRSGSPSVICMHHSRILDRCTDNTHHTCNGGEAGNLPQTEKPRIIRSMSN